MDKKTALRASAKDLRKTLDIYKISEDLVKKISQHKLYLNAKHIMIFYPKTNEINLLPLLSDTKNFYLPRINGKFLEICPYKHGDKLAKSQFNTLEPLTKAIAPEILDLIIVPALMADKQGYRLGYGGGYYDRLLSYCKSKTMCVLPKELVTETLPHEKHDIKIDTIIYL